MDYCFSCFGAPNHTDNERDPLLPKHGPERRDERASTVVERPVVEKIVDMLAALNAGKLPTQDQFSYFLQVLLRSELLKEDRGKIIPGNGPMSKQGRKALSDVRILAQALLQFGMEKNDDDKFQEVYFQMLQVDALPVEVQVNVDAPAAYKAGQTALDTTKQAPTQDQLAFDAATFLHALRTILESCISSPVFRLILVDLFSVARDIVALAAADVGRAASQVQQAAETVEQKAREGDDVIAKEEDGKIKMEVNIDGLKNTGKETAEKVTSGAQGVRNEWEELGEEVADKTKEKILERIQQVIFRIQKDQASRSAMHAILTLARKYADKIATASEIASATISDAAKQTVDTLNADAGETNYPPHPYGEPKTSKPIIDVTSDALLYDFKDILQRLGQNYSVDGLLSALGRVVRDLNDVPAVLGDEVNKSLDEKMEDATAETQSPPTSHHVQAQPGKGKGKGKKHKKGRKKHRAAAEQESLLSPSEGFFSPLEQGRGNPLHTYFARLGQYLDKALDEPGWAMSKDGAKTLEGLFDDGAELINVVGESIIEVEEAVETKSASSPNPDNYKDPKDEDIRRQFTKDLKSLMDEADAYVSAVENDMTTMQVARALDGLREDISALVFQGAREGRRSFSPKIFGMRGWTDWIGWMIPRLLHMLPAGAIPIPLIEIKTGNIEASLQALFVQGLARGKEDVLRTSLVPDEVVLKEWTEIRVDMAEREGPVAGPLDPSSSSLLRPGMQTTSRVRMHMDGVRAKVENMGYYFKYNGSIIGYEDEGVLSVDVGTGSPHDGLGADVEIEIESDNMPFDTGVEIPQIIIEGEEEGLNEAANRDILVQGPATTLRSSIDQRAAVAGAAEPAEPLFRIVDVQVAMRGLRFRIDKSKHWILNKLFLQSLAGPVVARVARQAIEEKLRGGLEVLAQGMGAVVEDAKRKGEARRARQTAKIVQQHPARALGLTDEEMEEGLADILPDWWDAVLQTDPAMFGYDVSGDTDTDTGLNSDRVRTDAETSTRTAATTKGIIHTSKTSMTEQPAGHPAMVYNKSTASMERVDLTPEDTSGPPPEESVESETVIAVGTSPQLFPGKGGPHYFGPTDDEPEEEQRGLLDGVRDTARAAVNGAVRGVEEGADIVERIEDRWEDRTKKEETSKKTWKSDAFNFRI